MAELLDSFPGDDNIIPPENFRPIFDDDPVDLVPVTKDNVTLEIIIQSLTALAYKAGSPTRAAEEMATKGWAIDPAQIKRWSVGEYADDYKNIRDNFSKDSEAEMVREMRDTIRQAAAAEQLAIQKSLEGLQRNISGKDASQAAFNLARVKKENVDKLQTLLGRPTQIIEDRTAEKAIQRLIARRILKPIDSQPDES